MGRVPEPGGPQAEGGILRLLLRQVPEIVDLPVGKTGPGIAHQVGIDADLLHQRHGIDTIGFDDLQRGGNGGGRVE